MLRSLKGIWRWHRKAESGHPPSVTLPLHPAFVNSNDLSIQMIEPVEYGRFLFCDRRPWGEPSFAWRLAVIGSFWSCSGSL